LEVLKGPSESRSSQGDTHTGPHPYMCGTPGMHTVIYTRHTRAGTPGQDDMLVRRIMSSRKSGRLWIAVDVTAIRYMRAAWRAHASPRATKRNPRRATTHKTTRDHMRRPTRDHVRATRGLSAPSGHGRCMELYIMVPLAACAGDAAASSHRVYTRDGTEAEASGPLHGTRESRETKGCIRRAPQPLRRRRGSTYRGARERRAEGRRLRSRGQGATPRTRAASSRRDPARATSGLATRRSCSRACAARDPQCVSREAGRRTTTCRSSKAPRGSSASAGAARGARRSPSAPAALRRGSGRPP